VKDIFKSCTNGQVPYGYSYYKNRLTKNPAEQKIICDIIAQRKAGKSLREICRYLTSRNTPTKNGGKWQANTVRKIIESSVMK